MGVGEGCCFSFKGELVFFCSLVVRGSLGLEFMDGRWVVGLGV